MSPKTKSELEVLNDILDRLDLLINLTAMLVTSERSTTEAARALKMAGLDNQTIASVLNTTVGSIRALTANLRVKIGKARG